MRRSRAAPKSGWSLQDLAGLLGVASRTVRHYVARELLPRPAFKGRATRYGRAQLLAAVAIQRLRATERLGLTAIRARLRALSESELEALATDGLRPGPLADALGLRAPPPGSGAGGHAQSQLPAIAAQVPRWARIELALGLELHVRTDASPAVLELARRIHASSRSWSGAEDSV